jgi:MtN3 and saliva related transmembrane protein
MLLYIFGTLGGTIGICSQIPQLVKSWRTKKVRDLSIKTYYLLVLNNSLWLIHGLINNDPALYITNAIAIFIPIGVIIAIHKYK